MPFSVQGGVKFHITLNKELPKDVKSGMAHFDGVGDVSLDTLNRCTFTGTTPGKS